MEGHAKTRYEALEKARQPYLDRGRKCAKLTLPALLPPEGSQDGSQTFTTPEQSVGARGVNNIAAKLLMALFPPSAPYLKMEVDAMEAFKLTEQTGSKDEIDKAFAQYVRRIMTDFESRALRSDFYEVFRHLVISGNAAFYLPSEGRGRVFRLDKYVCQRDPSGSLLEWVGKETVAYAALPEDVQKTIPLSHEDTTDSKGALPTKPIDKTVDLYTHVILNQEGTYTVYQEANGVVVEDTVGEYEPDALPFLVLRYNKIDGESFGRGLVEEYLGDLRHLETLSKSMREYVAIASRIIPLINPNASLEPKDLTDAQNGEPVVGSRDDVSYLQLERDHDFQAGRVMMNELQQRLAFAFLMNTAIQRQGERVTAEEIRYMARELEDTLGGVYSLLALDLQLPLAKVQIAQLESTGALPELPKNIATPKIVTGMDALGRGNDLSNLMQFLSIIGQSPAVESLKWDQISLRVANGLNIETDGLIMSEQELQQKHQQEMMKQAMQTMGGAAVNQMGQLAQQQMETGQSEQ